jgi:hypothetical protein
LHMAGSEGSTNHTFKLALVKPPICECTRNQTHNNSRTSTPHLRSWPILPSAMKCVILVAGHNVRLEDEINSDTTGRYKHLVGVPKALLPTTTAKSLLDCWYVISARVFLARHWEIEVVSVSPPPPPRNRTGLFFRSSTRTKLRCLFSSHQRQLKSSRCVSNTTQHALACLLYSDRTRLLVVGDDARRTGPPHHIQPPTWILGFQVAFNLPLHSHPSPPPSLLLSPVENSTGGRRFRRATSLMACTL